MNPASIILACVLVLPGGEKADFESLGTGPGGSTEARALGVSGDGRTIVGWTRLSVQPRHAFRWTPETGFEDLGQNDPICGGFTGLAEGRAANFTGDLVMGYKGVACSCSCAADLEGCFCYATFRWTATGAQDEVAPEACGGLTYLEPYGMSDDAAVMAGATLLGDCLGFHPFRWTANGGIDVLPLLGSGDGFHGEARGVARDGSEVVGFAEGPGGRTPVRWVGAGEAEPLCDEGSTEHEMAVDSASTGGVIVGTSSTLEGGELRAFLWTPGSGAISLGVIDGSTRSEARAISGDGQVVVGQCFDPSQGDIGMIWDFDNDMRDLRLVIEEATGLSLSGWRLLPQDISADGTVIVGYAFNPEGEIEAWRAVLPRSGLIDTDGDGLFDSWETDGIPYVDSSGLEQLYKLDWNQDGVIDADPLRKDIFVEIDAMDDPGLAPTSGDLQRVRNAFARAPVANPDGSQGISLHLRIDETNIDTFDFAPVWDDFDTVKTLHFGTLAERTGDDETVIARLDAKRKAYRYCVFGSQLGTTDISGVAEIGGNDLIVTLGHPGWGGGTSKEKAGTFMHELGHTLGLRHGGPESELSGDEESGPDHAYNYKPNYYSIMNYQWQYPRPWHKPGSWPLDASNPGYSVALLRELDENDLSEELGLVPPESAAFYPAPGFDVLCNLETDPTQPPFAVTVLLEAGSGIDYDLDGIVEDPPLSIALDVNHVDASEPASAYDVLESHVDWPFLVYNFRSSVDFAEGSHATVAENELTFAMHQSLNDAAPPACVGDVVSNDAVDVQDLLELLAKWGPCTEGIACVQDLDDDGQIGVGDLLAVLAAWGPCG